MTTPFILKHFGEQTAQFSFETIILSFGRVAGIFSTWMWLSQEEYDKANFSGESIFYFIFNVFIYFWEREREHELGRGRERERERETESDSGSRLWAVSTEPDMGFELVNHDIMTSAEVGHSIDWGTQEPQEYFLKSWKSIVGGTGLGESGLHIQYPWKSDSGANDFIYKRTCVIHFT